jgi:DNA-binding NarL/FixJ family response regulator
VPAGNVDEGSAALIADFFLAHEEWDHAFEVASAVPLHHVLSLTIERGLDPMLRRGRLATVGRWVNVALSLNLDLAIVDLADAELAFRQAEHDRAYVLASQAAVRFTDPQLATRAHTRAGHSALLSSREPAALEHFRNAVQLAPDWEARRESLVGLYFAASELGTEDAPQALAELEAAEEHSPDGILRREVLRLIHAARTGGNVSDTADSALPKLHLIERATEPLGITGFLHALTTSLNLAARYEEALGLAGKQLELASKYRLHFPVAHAYLNEAISQAGLGNFARAAGALRQVEGQIPAGGDAYLAATVRVIRCRLFTAQRRFDEAIHLTTDGGSGITSPPLHAEYLASRALALACRGDSEDATEATAEAEAIFPFSVDVRVLAPCVRAVISIQGNDEAEKAGQARRAWGAAVSTSSFDSFVCAYRAMPELLTILMRDSGVKSQLARLLARSRDHELARQHEIAIPPARLDLPPMLTRREADVLRHLEQGSSNREIARRLFISEATVKAHLRHIYEKLGVKTRAELLARSTRRSP